MSQTNLTIRIDEDLKRDAESLFNKIGINISTAIIIYFRQAIRTQEIPFELKPYDDYFTGKRMERILHSVEQAQKGETITKTFSELEAMEND
ncbi:MAG: type II toxin-antitoxin system RelB/DinJ family antitoxin [Oscillospiraceae bacterium]|nr:type II toxin-antitoxin system RelB/DinJ family antitoxin [Oscillospiraceae bacterium]